VTKSVEAHSPQRRAGVSLIHALAAKRTNCLPPTIVEGVAGLRSRSPPGATERPIAFWLELALPPGGDGEANLHHAVRLSECGSPPGPELASSGSSPRSEINTGPNPNPNPPLPRATLDAAWL
jgi:hypothetical protein